MSQPRLKILVTGAAGSAGSYMLEHLVASEPWNDYVALVRNPDLSKQRNLQAVRDKIHIEVCDLGHYEKVLEIIKQNAPEQVYHFASDADVKKSFEQPRAILNNNIGSTVNLLDACCQLPRKPRVLLCSTSEVYGQVLPHETPIRESNPLRPASPYAVSKTTQDLLGDVYVKAYGLPVVRSRMFTYINPRRANLFATSFALQVARIELGLQSELLHGNLNSVRTHIDIRDVVESYRLLMQKGITGEVYNLGGTEPFTVGDFLEILKSKARCQIRSRSDESLIRPVDVTLQIPDVSKFTALTGWVPKYSLQESIDHLLEECRQQVKK